MSHLCPRCGENLTEILADRTKIVCPACKFYYRAPGDSQDTAGAGGTGQQGVAESVPLSPASAAGILRPASRSQRLTAGLFDGLFAGAAAYLISLQVGPSAIRLFGQLGERYQIPHLSQLLPSGHVIMSDGTEMIRGNRFVPVPGASMAYQDLVSATSNMVTLLVVLIVAALYQTIETGLSASPGKLLQGLVIRRASGEAAAVGWQFLRSFIKLLPLWLMILGSFGGISFFVVLAILSLPISIVGSLAIFGESGKSLHDQLAGTGVFVRKSRRG